MMVRRVAVLALGLTLSLPSMAWQAGKGPRPQGRPNFGGNSSGPGPHAGDWLRKNMHRPPEEQQKALESDDEFKNLDPQQKDRLRQKLQRFNSLTPEQKQRWIQRMDWYEHLSPEQRERARGLQQQLRELPQDRRRAMRQAMREMREMPADEKRKALDSDKMKSSFSEQERQIMKGFTELRESDDNQQ